MGVIIHRRSAHQKIVSFWHLLNNTFRLQLADFFIIERNIKIDIRVIYHTVIGQHFNAFSFRFGDDVA